MQVGGAHVECVQKHLVQELDNRCVIDFGGVDLAGIGCCVHRGLIELEITADEVFHRFGDGRCVLFDHTGEFVELGDDPLHTHLGGELDFFGCCLVCGIGGRDDKPVPAFAQDEDAEIKAGLRIQQALRKPIAIQCVQIHQWGCERHRHGVCEVCGRDGTGARQFGDERGLAGLCLAVDVFSRLLAQFPSGDQGARQARQGDGRRVFGGRICDSHEV